MNKVVPFPAHLVGPPTTTALVRVRSPLPDRPGMLVAGIELTFPVLDHLTARASALLVDEDDDALCALSFRERSPIIYAVSKSPGHTLASPWARALEDLGRPRRQWTLVQGRLSLPGIPFFAAPRTYLRVTRRRLSWALHLRGFKAWTATLPSAVLTDLWTRHTEAAARRKRSLKRHSPDSAHRCD